MMNDEIGQNSRLPLGEDSATMTSQLKCENKFSTDRKVRKKMWMIILPTYEG